MDLHEHKIVAEYYDHYADQLADQSGLDSQSCIDFHIELANQHGSDGILDIACGTGNTTIPLLKQGFSVVSVDLSTEMIRILREKLSNDPQIDSEKSTLLNENMTSFSIDKKASLAMIPRSGFMHLLTPEDQQTALHNIRNHLRSGGILTLNTYDPNLPFIAANQDETQKKLSKRTEFTNLDGNKVEIYNSFLFHPGNQTLDAIWLFREHIDSQNVNEVQFPLNMRYTFRQEMLYLFKIAGFEVLSLYGDYKKNPPEYPSQLIWVVAKI